MIILVPYLHKFEIKIQLYLPMAHLNIAIDMVYDSYVLFFQFRETFLYVLIVVDYR